MRRRSTTTWWLGSLPVVMAGVALFIWLPASPDSVSHAAAALSVSKPSVMRPSILAAAAEEARTTPHVTTAALEVPLPDATTKSSDSVLLLQSVANRPIAADWAAYVGHAVPVVGSVGPLPAGLGDGHIGSQAVNARSEPNAASGVQFVFAPGEPVKLGETNGSWRHVYRPSGENGWVFTRYIDDPAAPRPPVVTTASADPEAAAPSTGPRPGSYLASRSPVPVRSTPDAGAALSFVLAPGETFRVQDTRGRWMRVVTQDGYSGWIPS